MKCEICRVVDRTCREPLPLIQGRIQKDKGVETVVFEKIKDCPIRKANQWPSSKV
jgi:hypothetical protein